MKRKFADRRNWKRVKKKRYSQYRIDDAVFNGYLGIVEIDKVAEPLYVSVCGTQVCVVDSGYTWMQFFPDNCAYVMTAMFDRTRNMAEWYFDICKQHGLGTDGIPYLDDLFLDVVVSSNFDIELLDQDELEAALANRIISQQDYDFAQREAHQLITCIKEKKMPLLSSSIDYLNKYVVKNK